MCLSSFSGFGRRAPTPELQRVGGMPNLGSLYLDGVIPSCEFVSKLKNLWAFSCREIANDDCHR